MSAAREDRLPANELAALQRSKLGAMLAAVQPGNRFYQRKLSSAAFDAAGDPMDRLPFTTRGELQQDQIDHPPYGSNLTYPVDQYHRLHQTSGSGGAPLRWLDTADGWEWFKQCWAVIYRAADLSPCDRLIFPFSFGPFIGFWAAFESAAMLGNLCLAAGGMTTTARLRYLLDNDVTVVCCTPTYALRMAEVAASERIDLAASTVRALIVAGEPGGNIPATRRRIESAWGARVFDHAGMTEMGAWGFECVEAPGGLHVIESEFIAEVIDPVTTRPVPDGEPGELVLTNLGRIGSPLIRYRTGDQVRLTRGRCACGRTFARCEGGVLGRIDDMLIIRGNNVFPAAIEGIVQEFAEVAEFRIRVERHRLETGATGSLAELVIDVEPRPDVQTAGLAERLASAVRDQLHFRPIVALAPAGSLPRFEMKARRVQVTGSENDGAT